MNSKTVFSGTCSVCRSTTWLVDEQGATVCDGCTSLAPSPREELLEEEARGPVEVMRVAVISTLHLSRLELDRLPDGKNGNDFPLASMGNEYGAVVYVADGRNNLENAPDESLSCWPGLLAVIAWANRRGFEWVRFDVEADIRAALPCWIE